MANPARELAQLFESWTVPKGQHPHGYRAAVAKERGTTLGREHARAIALMSEIDRRIDELQAHGIDVDHFRDTVPRWQEALFSHSAPWTTVVPRSTPCINDDHLRLLRSLAGQIDLLGATLALPAERVGAALRKIEAAERFVSEAEDINDSMRHYLLALLAEIREALDGGRPAGPKAAEFIGAATLIAQSPTSSEETRTRWQDVAINFATNFTSGAAVLLIQAATGI